MTHERFSSPMAFDMALQDPIFAICHRGLLIDQELRAKLIEERHEEWKGLQVALARLAGRHINVNSTQGKDGGQVAAWLFGDLGLPPRKVKGKISTKESKLRAVMAECSDKVATLKTEDAKLRWMIGELGIMLILKIRGIRKELSSYLEIDIDDDGRIRQSLRIGGTETGRFASSKTNWNTGCNLQTIPRALRKMMIAPEGKVLCEFDLNRGESWIYAHLSNDPEMMRIHHDGLDFHSETASVISTVFGEGLTVDYIVTHKNGECYKIRFLGKKINHASAYRMGEFKQAEVINDEAEATGITVTVREARQAQRLWRQKYFMMPEWWASIERQLNKDRTLTTPYGRRRTFYSFWGKDLFKEATAWTPQSTSVDYMNLGMLDVWNKLDQKGAFGIRLLHQNHDSILVEMDEDRIDEGIPEVLDRLHRTVVVNDHEITIPVEASYGPSWGEQTEWNG